MSRDYAEYICDLLSPLGPVTARAMFGGFGIYLDGLTFALIADDTLYFKVDDHNRAAFQAAGSHPFKPFPDKAMVMSYWDVPVEIFDDPDELCRWARDAYDVALRARKPKRPRKKPA